MHVSFRVFRYVWEKETGQWYREGCFNYLECFLLEYKFVKNRTKYSYMLNLWIVLTWVFIIILCMLEIFQH